MLRCIQRVAQDSTSSFGVAQRRRKLGHPCESFSSWIPDTKAKCLSPDFLRSHRVRVTLRVKLGVAHGHSPIKDAPERSPCPSSRDQCVVKSVLIKEAVQKSVSLPESSF